RPPLPGSSFWLNLIRFTKTPRTGYDHFMLRLHDRMKADEQYQKSPVGTVFDFPAGSTWAAFTDQVSHAALSGIHQLEQTFTLPVARMHHPECSPLYILESLAGRRLAA